MKNRDHGGNLDAAVARFGGHRDDWIDLSTGIAPFAFPLPTLPSHVWTALPTKTEETALTDAARRFWNVPDQAAIVASPGASLLIAQIPHLAAAGTVQIAEPTYNEHAAAFALAGWQKTGDAADATVIVHPNNPDGRLWSGEWPDATLNVIDESFCDVVPDASFVSQATRPGTLILKSLGKFWGLAGLRLGFAIGDPDLIAFLKERMGPWPVSGPALAIATAALSDPAWAARQRERLAIAAQELDALMGAHGTIVGGTSLFRLYDVDDAEGWQTRLAGQRIWSRTFPYNTRWLRLGIPPEHGWARLEALA